MEKKTCYKILILSLSLSNFLPISYPLQCSLSSIASSFYTFLLLLSLSLPFCLVLSNLLAQLYANTISNIFHIGSKTRNWLMLFSLKNEILLMDVILKVYLLYFLSWPSLNLPSSALSFSLSLFLSISCPCQSRTMLVRVKWMRETRGFIFDGRSVGGGRLFSTRRLFYFWADFLQQIN